jgi:hypothetical protein
MIYRKSTDKGDGIQLYGQGFGWPAVGIKLLQVFSVLIF